MDEDEIEKQSYLKVGLEKEKSKVEKYSSNFKAILCECSSSGLLIEDDKYGIYLSFFERGRYIDNKLDILSRLRFAWKILSTGRPYCDDIILNKTTAKILAKELQVRCARLE